MSTLGIVVIGRNEGDRLRGCLQALQSSAAPIVYADSNSSDDSVRIAGALGAIVVELDPSRPMNAARGRKEGTQALVAHWPDLDYVFYVDGDCITDPNFLSAATAFLDKHPNAAAVCGRRFEAHPEASFYNRLCDEEWNTPVGRAEACGGDSVMRLAAVQQVGGFDESLMASEEPELSARMRAAGWEIWRIDARMTQHDAAITSLRAYLRRHHRGGIGYFQAWRKTASLPERINGRTLRSATFWAAGVLLLSLLLAAVAQNGWLLLLTPLAYALQISRIAVRFGARSAFSWQRAAALMLIKFAEFGGAASAALKGGARDSIPYKAS